MKTSMNVNFRILKNTGTGKFIPVNEFEATDISIGGFRFDIGQYSVPFDWNAFESGWDVQGFFSVTTGRGWFYNDFEPDSCYDDYYEEIGLKREDISAAFLASAHHIEDFYINFVVNGEECEAGYWNHNKNPDAPYRLELLSVGFEDVVSGEVYAVDSKVLEAFNKGEKGLYLEHVIDSAVSRSHMPISDGKEIVFDNDYKHC